MSTDAHDGTDKFLRGGMLDARDRVTGQVPYAIDTQLPGMLHARLLRSTEPHALIRRVDVSRALAVRGVSAALTGADLAARGDVRPYYGPVFRDQPILAIGKVRFIGEPIVAVAATDLDTAQEAIDRIVVEYEPLPAVFDVDAALAPDAPLLHEGAPKTGRTFADVIVRAQGGTNVCNHFKLRKGDIEAGLAAADNVFDDVFTSPPVQHVPLETHACVADVHDRRVTVWVGTQTPFNVRSQLAEIFGLPLSRVRVLVPTLGGAYGSKCYPKIEPVTAALSLVTRRPVRLHLSRAEEFVTVTKHGAVIQLTTGLRSDGTIIARKATCHFNTGAYADIGPRLIKNGGYGTGGPHHIPHIWVDSYAVYTNLPPAGAFRGYGISQAAWAYDTQLDMIADRLGLDPFAFRMQNLLVDGQSVMTGEPMHDAHFRELLGNAANWIGWNSGPPVVRNGSLVRAKGLSCIIKGSVTPSVSTAAVRLNDDGSLDILTSSVEMGQGVHMTLALIAAKRLTISPDRIHVSTPDTDTTPYDQQTSASRTTHSMGTAVAGAADDLKAQLLKYASDELEIAPADLELVDGCVTAKDAPRRAIDFGDLVRRTRSGSLTGTFTFRTEGGLDPETGQGIGSAHWHQAAGAAEIQVDLETGKVEVIRYHAGVYAGRIVNPVQAELQTEGCISFGLGQSLFEEMLFDGGQLQNGTLSDYMITSMRDIPDTHTEILESPEGAEVHGIGETSLPPVMPAIGNAVFRATGVRITDLPITPEKVLRGLRAQSERGLGDQ